MGHRIAASRLTWGVGIGGIAIVTAVYSGILAAVGGEGGSAVITYLTEPVLLLAAFLLILRAAITLRNGESLMSQWLLIGMGVLMHAAGDAVNANVAVGFVRGVYVPGEAAFFYILQYVFIGLGVMLVAISYRKLVPVGSRFLFALFVTAMAAGFVYVLMLRDIAIDPMLSLTDKALTVLTPIGDIMLLLGPAVLVLLMVARVGDGRLAWPWWWLAGGMALYAVSDTAYAVLKTHESYRPGQLVDAGWMLASVCVAVAASLAWDVAHPAALAARERDLAEPASSAADA